MTVTVNGEAITNEQIEQEMERLRQDYVRMFAEQPEEQRENTLREWSQENLIEQVLLRQAAERSVTIPDEQIDRELNRLYEQSGGKAKFCADNDITTEKEKQLRDDLRAQLQVRTFIEQLCAKLPAPGEKEIEKYYRANIEKFTIPEMVHAAHIVRHHGPKLNAKTLREEMEKVHARLETGEDFAALASEHSDCPDNSGDLGWFARGKMVPLFEEQVFALEPGQVSGVFDTEFGYHIARVIERKAAIPCPLRDVREVIVRELSEEMKNKRIENFLDGEKPKADIQIQA